MTSGLVGEMSFQFLPTVSPLVTVVLTLTAMLVSFRDGILAVVWHMLSAYDLWY